jgi:alpha-beta hydrolase superfamily lysophospholipase
MHPQPPSRTDTLIARDCVKLHVAHWPRRDAKGVVVFFHGLTGRGGWYEEFAGVLRKAGWIMVAPDYRGHGHSEGPRGGLARDDDLLFDAATVIDHVQHNYPKLPVVLMGISTGGLVSCRFGVHADHTQPWWRRCDGIVTMSPALQPAMGLAKRVLTPTEGRVTLDEPIQLNIDPALSCSDPEIVKVLRADPMRHNQVTPRFTLFLGREGIRVLDHAADWRTPTLVLYSADDKLIELEGCRSFVRQAPASKVSVHEFNGMAHNLLHEPQRALVHESVTTWLARQFG